MAKKILKVSGIVLLILILLAFLIPVLFKGKILTMAREGINKNVNAKVDFEDVDISLFRHFPRLSVALEKLQITGAGSFAKDTLIATRQIDVSVNLMSLFGGSATSIYSITVDEPRIHLIVNKQGEANWNITKPDSSQPAAAGSAGTFNLNLKSYEIKDGYISYQDVPGGMSSEISHLTHRGSGDFTADLFTLKTATTAESVSFSYGGIPYLVQANTSLDADIEVDNKTNKYSFKTDQIRVNDLKLSSDGFFQFVNDTTYGMDIRFSAPSTEFKTLLSLVPAIYKNDFAKIKTSGTAAFNGFVKGQYNSANIPAYQVNLDVNNGFFQYPDLPQPVQHIAIHMKIDNPDGITDHTVVNISQGHIEFGADPFDFKLLLKNPLTDQYLDATLKGKLNLAQITQFVKLSGDTKLSGVLDADVTAKGNMSAITKKKPGPFMANGFLTVSNLNYSSKDLPQPVRNTNLQINFQNPDGNADHTVINIPVAHVEVGAEPIDFTLMVKNPVSDLYFDGRATGRFNLANIGQFTQLEPGTTIAGNLAADIAFKGNKSAIDQKKYDKILLAGTLNINGVNYVSKTLTSAVKVPEAAFQFNPKNITLKTARAEYANTHYTATGSIDNAIGYALRNEPVAGNLSVHADQIDLNQLMGTQPAATDTAAAVSGTPFVVPNNLDFVFNATVDKLVYGKVIYDNLAGTVTIRDETVSLKNLQMDALDGKIVATGSYSTKVSKKQPEISFSYDLARVDVQKTFQAFNTVQKLMPVARFVAGKANSQFSITGKLNGDMSPVIGSLTGKGNLLFLDGALQHFAPAEKLAQSLNISELAGLSLKDIKIFFEFANGKVLIKPFHAKVSSIDMEIGGMHGLDESIDYSVAMKIPRSMFGAGANALVDGLVQQAANKGVPVKLGDNVNVNVKIGGTLTKPVIKTDLKEAGSSLAAEMKKQADEFTKQAEDSAKAVLNAKKKEAADSAQAIKQQAIKDLGNDISKTLNGSKDTTKGKPLESTQKNAEKAVQNTLNSLFKKKKPATEPTK